MEPCSTRKASTKRAEAGAEGPHAEGQERRPVVALRGLAGAQGDQRSPQGQAKDVQRGQPPVGQGQPGEKGIIRAKFSMTSQMQDLLAGNKVLKLFWQKMEKKH